MERVGEVLEFWFGRPGEAGHGARREVWFKVDPAFDAEVAERFAALYESAARGGLEDWPEGPRAALALVILCDQFPRNLFRQSPRAFESDARALALARHAVERGFDQALTPIERQFLYMPFQHSEAADDQRRSVELFASIAHVAEGEKSLAHAIEHREVIARFDRFPHRNAVLGRTSTPEEQAYLEDPEALFAPGR